MRRMTNQQISFGGNGLWNAVARRDARADGLFVYAVRSTGVYCRPSCPSRRPHADRVEFFPPGSMAEAAGYRACRRCHPESETARSAVSDRVVRACQAVARRPDAHWTSAAIARAGQTSVPQLQRAFRRVLNLTPKDYVAACRRRRFLASLKNGHRVTDAVYEAGYGSPSRVYGSIRMPGMTPATYGRGGLGATIDWLTIDSSIGRILVAGTARGLCFVEIDRDDTTLVKTLRSEFPAATIADEPAAALAPLASAAKAIAEAGSVPADLPLDIKGTAFQWRVWRALTEIPRGETRTYTEVASAIGEPSAVRAVARACATNPVSLVVPCHRVVGRDGSLRGYRWGLGVKRALIERERQR